MVCFVFDNAVYKIVAVAYSWVSTLQFRNMRLFNFYKEWFKDNYRILVTKLDQTLNLNIPEI